MTTKTTLGVGRRSNRNETLVRDIRWAGLKSKTRVRAGIGFHYSKVEMSDLKAK